MEARERVAQLYLEAREGVYRYLLTFGIPPAQAQELTQDSFLRLYESMSGDDSIREPRAWLFRVAHNLAVNLRTRERTPAPLDETLYGSLRDHAQGPEDALIDRQRMARISRAMATLSPQQKQVLALRANGLRFREIAETLEIGVSSVYEFLNRAVRRLKKAADGNHLDPEQLLALLDGDVPEAEHHLRACPACRERMDVLRSGLGDYLAWHEHVLTPATAPQPAAWKALTPAWTLSTPAWRPVGPAIVSCRRSPKPVASG